MQIGDFVKISNGYERFWVKITGFGPDQIKGTIDNYLEMSPQKYGDSITVKRDEVLDFKPMLRAV